MSRFPVIQSPCPYKGKLADIMQGDMCRLCERQVHDLTALSQAQRQALLAGCKDEICVSYAISARSVLAAAALGIAATATPLAAQETATAAAEEPDIIIVAGGMRAPKQAKWLKDEPAALSVPALPVVVEDAPAPRKAQRRTRKQAES